MVGIKEVSEHFGMHQSTIRRLVHQGLIPAYSTRPGRGGRWVFDIDEVRSALRVIPKAKVTDLEELEKEFEDVGN